MDVFAKLPDIVINLPVSLIPGIPQNPDSGLFSFIHIYGFNKFLFRGEAALELNARQLALIYIVSQKNTAQDGNNQDDIQ